MGESTALLAQGPGRALRKTNVAEKGPEELKAHRPFAGREARAGWLLGVAFGQENRVQIPRGDREEGTNLSRGKITANVIKCEWLRQAMARGRSQETQLRKSPKVLQCEVMRRA